MVCKTVLLELEWVMRGYYGLPSDQISQALRHLVSLQHVQVEDLAAVEQALGGYEAGLDFADALHQASYRQCEGMTTFDDRRFARRVRRMGLLPAVTVCR